MLSKAQIKFIRSLHQKKNRQIHQLFVVEGSRMVHELIETHPNFVEQIVVTKAYAETHEFPEGIQVDLVDEQTFEKLSKSVSPQGILAVFAQPKLTYTPQDFMLALDHIQDPGNMGTIIRLADWFGVKQIICSPDCVEVFNSKVVQSSMGSVFRVPMCYMPLEEVLQQTELPVYGAILEGENVYSQNLQPRGILVMGNEGNGIREEFLHLISSPLTIPRLGEGESLNVSMATGILLSEFFRGTAK
jgi:RNA methyltransferase, TrmH family